MNFKTKAAQAQIVAFYNGPWLDIPFQSIDTSFVFPLTHEIADELERGRRGNSWRREQVQDVSRDGGLLCSGPQTQDADTIHIRVVAVSTFDGGDHAAR